MGCCSSGPGVVLFSFLIEANLLSSLKQVNAADSLEPIAQPNFSLGTRTDAVARLFRGGLQHYLKSADSRGLCNRLQIFRLSNHIELHIRRIPLVRSWPREPRDTRGKNWDQDNSDSIFDFA
jgi:hypothetical protein